MLSVAYYRDRVLVIASVLLFPWFCILTYGWLPSLSAYWNTPLQPVFIAANAITAYYLFFVNSWKPSAVLLILTTSFSVEWWPQLHNMFAVLFFLITIVPIYNTRRYRIWFWVYLGAIPCLLHSLLLTEIICINAIAGHNISALKAAYRLQLKKV